MRGEYLEFAVDNGLLTVDGQASVAELVEYSHSVYDMAAHNTIKKLMKTGSLPTEWVECGVLDEDEFWEHMRTHLEARDEQNG